jgi:hypothetical protein
MAWNQSKIKMWRRCQRQYAFRYDTNPPLELVPRVARKPLKRGTWMHELQAAYLTGGDWRERHDELTAEFDSLFEEEKVELGDLPEECRRLFVSYLRWRKQQGHAERYRIADLPDGSGPAVEFVIEVPLDRYGITSPFKGRVDRLVEDSEYGGLWIHDAKWVKSVPKPDERMMSPQAVMYVWGLRKLGFDIRGFVYEYGRTKAPTIPPQLKTRGGLLTTRHKLDTDYYTYLSEVKRVHGDQWKLYAKRVYITKLRELKGRENLWFRLERIPVDEGRIKRGLMEFLVSIKDAEKRNLKHPPRTYDFRCLWDCAYHELCVAEFTGLDIQPLLKRHYTYEEERYENGEEDDE